MSKSKKRRKPVPSLSPRVQRRASLITAVEEDDYSVDRHGDDENCPVCAAARENRPISFDVVRAPQYLIAEARRVIQRTPPGPGEEVSISLTGRLMPDQSYELVSYSVDSTGAIYKTRNGVRTLVMRLPLA